MGDRISLSWKLFHFRKPTVDPEEVRRLSEALARHPAHNTLNLSPGDQIRVVDGPFEKLTGTIEVVEEDRARLKAQVKVFGRNTPVELHFTQVEKL